jgi:Icc-related predicted phosphoesterase
MRLYFCSDIHGSEKCWLKFLATPKFYEADVIVLGGDITGKFVVPIVKKPNGRWTATYLGLQRRVSTEDELRKLEQQMAYSGYYGFRTTAEEAAYYAESQDRIEELTKKLMLARLSQWLEVADARLKDSGIHCLVIAGNDDAFEVDALLAQSKVLENPDGRVLNLNGSIEVIGLSYANMTPWRCSRDVPEEELAQRIEAAASSLARPERAIFDLHVPPYRSGLDMAPRLDDDLRVVMSGEGPQLVPVGSKAVREAIEKYQPMLGLHGHVHESKGVAQIGRTTVVNPGSEYAEGILNGVLIDIDEIKGAIVSTQFVSG